MTNGLAKHLRKESAITFAINAPLNGWFTWILMGKHSSLPAFGEHSYVLDLMIIGALLPIMLTPLFILLHRRKLRKGSMEAIVINGGLLAPLARRSIWQQTLVFGILGALLALLAGLVINLISSSLTPANYAVIKGLFAGLICVGTVIPTIKLGLVEKPC